MAYSDFSLRKAKTTFDLNITENQDVFSHLPEVAVGERFKSTLKENITLALAINTEKARSELIIADVILELRHILAKQMSFFSGVNFDVDKALNLNGFCDYILSKSPEQLYLSAPIVVLVEAKSENIVGGLGQCVAEMVAASLFNEREGNEIETIYGTVTTGSVWKFLKLRQNDVYIDTIEYHINNPEKILGILVAMLNLVA